MKTNLLKTLVIAVTTFACTFGTAAAKEPIRIGVVISLSGPASVYGAPVPKTMQMLVDQLPGKQIAGHPVEMVIVDAESSSTKAVQLTRRLIDRDEVHVVVGPTLSGEALPVVAVVNQAKVSNLTYGSAAAVTSPVTPYVFSVTSSDRVGVLAILEHLQNRGIKRIASIFSQDGFGQGGQRIIMENVSKHGMQLVMSESYAPQDTDMTAQLLRISNAKDVEAVVVWAPLPGPTILLRNAHNLKIKLPFFLGYAQSSNAFAEQLGAAGEGAYVAALPIIAPSALPKDDARRQRLIDVTEQYKERYGTDVDLFVGNTLDSFDVIKSALEKLNGPLTRESLRNAIESLEFCGANGCRAYRPDDHMGLTRSGLVMLEIKDGKFQAATVR